MTTILVQPSGTEIHVDPDDTVLGGLQKAGYAYTVGCRRGGCGICKVDALRGPSPTTGRWPTRSSPPRSAPTAPA